MEMIDNQKFNLNQIIDSYSGNKFSVGDYIDVKELSKTGIFHCIHQGKIRSIFINHGNNDSSVNISLKDINTHAILNFTLFNSKGNYYFIEHSDFNYILENKFLNDFYSFFIGDIDINGKNYSLEGGEDLYNLDDDIVKGFKIKSLIRKYDNCKFKMNDIIYNENEDSYSLIYNFYYNPGKKVVINLVDLYPQLSYGFILSFLNVRIANNDEINHFPISYP